MSLEIKNVSFSYENKAILKDVSFSLKKGQIGTLIGASGSGKSTLFKMLTGLLSPQTGDIIIENLRLPQGYDQVAYMMQQDLLLPWRTVLGNVQLVAELGPKEDLKKAEEQAINLLTDLGLKDDLYSYPDELSGGMRQRVSLARALLKQRPILLLDEPFGALDAGLREQMYQLLRRIKERYHITILMVTHDFHDALSLSDHLFLLADGLIQQEWTITSSLRQDFHHMGCLQEDLRRLLLRFS